MKEGFILGIFLKLVYLRKANILIIYPVCDVSVTFVTRPTEILHHFPNSGLNLL